MISYIKNFIIIILSFYCAVFSHPVHATITSFDCKKNSTSIEVTIKFFTNDLEKTLKHHGNHDLTIDSQKIIYNIDSLIFVYINKTLSLSIDKKKRQLLWVGKDLIFVYINKTLSLSIDKKKRQLLWVGKEIENNITWCYLEIINIDNVSSIKIENKLLLSIFDDQLNICHFYCADKPETIMLHKEKYIGEIKY